MTEMLEVSTVTRRFGGVVAVNDVSFGVEEGEIVGLIGPNGSGKTTTFNLISGNLAPNAGEIRYRGAPIQGLKAYEVARRGIGRTYQVVRPFPQLSVVENVMAGTFQKESNYNAARRLALDILDTLGLQDKADRPASDLTLLQLKRLEIAKVLSIGPDLLLLDEVAAGLTVNEMEVLLGFVRRLHDQGMTMLIVEHVMQFISSLCNRVLVLDFGKLIAEGTCENVLADPAVHEAYLGEEITVA
jgi:branched-chain amino acid transport system ATP-binding protein